METGSSRIKVLYVITGTGVGGAEKILHTTITGLDSNRYDLSLCSVKETGRIGEDLAHSGIVVTTLKVSDGSLLGGWLGSIAALFRLIVCCLRTRPVIVHSFLFRANILSRIAAYCTRVPVVISSVRVMGGEQKYCNTIERLTSFMVDRYVAVSGSVREYLVETAGVERKKVTIIYNGVDLAGERYRSTGVSPPVFAGQENFIISVGRLHRQKGHEFLIRAVAELKGTFSLPRLFIVGEGEEENSLKNLIQSLDLTNQVILTGLLTGIGSILHRAGLFVLPSLWEGMPNAVLEAMASGLPVVATAVGGVTELVNDGETGILVPPGDPVALARAIAELLRDTRRASEMGMAGKERVKAHFSSAAMIGRTDALYRELLQDGRRT